MSRFLSFLLGDGVEAMPRAEDLLDTRPNSSDVILDSFEGFLLGEDCVRERAKRLGIGDDGDGDDDDEARKIIKKRIIKKKVGASL